MPQKAAVAFECQRQSLSKQEAIECGLKAIGDNKTATTGMCLVNAGKDLGKVAQCAGLPNLPDISVTCLQKSSGGMGLFSCLDADKAFPAQVRKAAELGKCLVNAGNDPSKIAVCAGVALPPGVAKAAACIQQPSGTVAIATCFTLNNSIPDKVRQPVQCIAASNGDPFGSIVCVAAASSGLTQDQRIVLQCAAQTGGAPPAFALCAGGQMLVDTLIKCSSERFGEGHCFGKGNELQKLATALTGHMISGNSLVGKIFQVHLDAARYTVAAAKAVAKGLGNLVENLSREANRAQRNVSRELDKNYRQFVLKPIDWISKRINRLKRLF